MFNKLLFWVFLISVILLTLSLFAEKLSNCGTPSEQGILQGLDTIKNSWCNLCRFLKIISIGGLLCGAIIYLVSHFLEKDNY